VEMVPQVLRIRERKLNDLGFDINGVVGSIRRQVYLDWAKRSQREYQANRKETFQLACDVAAVILAKTSGRGRNLLVSDAQWKPHVETFRNGRCDP